MDPFCKSIIFSFGRGQEPKLLSIHRSGESCASPDGSGLVCTNSDVLVEQPRRSACFDAGDRRALGKKDMVIRRDEGLVRQHLCGYVKQEIRSLPLQGKCNLGGTVSKAKARR